MLQLPLVKFSWSVNTDDERSFQWTNVCDDLICLIDDSTPNSVMLRVVQRAQTLVRESLDILSVTNLGSNIPLLQEEVDLASRIKSAQQAQESARQHFIELQTSQLPIFALYRTDSLIIAIKYNLSNRMAYRP